MAALFCVRLGAFLTTIVNSMYERLGVGASGNDKEYFVVQRVLEAADVMGRFVSSFTL